MIRLAPLLLVAALAPVQCSRQYDPAKAREETAGDGLWALAEDFRAKGNESAYQATLRFLVARYPNSRRAPKAREELGLSGAPAPASSGQ